MHRIPQAVLRTLCAGVVVASMLAATLAGAVDHPVPAVQDKETAAQRNARMSWWREARFGMFIHWGLYAAPAGVWHDKDIRGLGEWLLHDAKAPVAEYSALAGSFNPTRFDAKTYVALAKAAGMKYMVITAKHHDGFAMYGSKANPFNIVDATPFHRDPIRELADECRKQGIRFGVYYSQDQDWTAPGAAAVGGHWDKAQDGDFDQYLNTKSVPQVEELLARYSPEVLWYDTPTQEMTPERAARFVAVTNKYPKLIWNNRLGGGYQGDTETPEQFIPPQGFPDKDWETCMTINNTWGFKSKDTNFKSTETLLRNLIDIASKGGNYLLNIGPDATGTIPQPEVERLQEIGRWLKVNGEAIYATGPTPFGSEAGSFSPTEKDRRGNPRWIAKWQWRATTKPGRIYIHLFEWPGESFHLENVKQTVRKAYMLADSQRKPLKLTQKGGTVDIGLAGRTPDAIATVLVLETTK